MNVRLLPAAKRDLRRGIRFYERQEDRLADLLDETFEAIEKIVGRLEAIEQPFGRV